MLTATPTQSISAAMESAAEYHRLTFVISAPRGGALSFCQSMEAMGGIGLPHTHLPLRQQMDDLKPLQSPLDLYGLDDGLVRALAAIIYGGFETYQLEAAYHDLATMYTRRTFSSTYSRFLENTSQRLYDPSFSLGLYPDLIPNVESSFPESQFIYLFRDPFFYAASVLTSIHGLDSLLIWWAMARKKQNDVTLDPLEMWCWINEELLNKIKLHRNPKTLKRMLFPEAVGRYSTERILQFIRSDYANSGVQSKSSTLVSRFAAGVKRRLTMTSRFDQWISHRARPVLSPIRDRTSWWLDITLGGDPSAHIGHHSDPSKQVPDYWRTIQEKPELISRCDELCQNLGFPMLSNRLAAWP